MKKVLLTTVVLFIISLFVGCGAFTGEGNVSQEQAARLTETYAIPTNTPPPTLTATPEPTLTPTITPTPEPTLTPTPTTYLNNPDGKIINVENIDQLENYDTIGKGLILSSTFSGDQKQVLVQTSRGLWLYEVETIREIEFYEGYEYFKVLPDGLSFATISPSLQIEIIEFSTGTINRSITVENAVSLGEISFSQNGNLFAVSVVQPHKTRLDYYSDRLDVYDVAQAELIAKLESDVIGPCSRFSFSNDDTQLISSCNPPGGGFRRLVNWSILDEEIIWALISSESFPDYPFSPDGKYISTNTREETIIRSALYSEEVNRVPGRLSTNAFSPDSHYFVTSSFELIRLWYVTNPKQDEAIQTGLLWPAATFSEDGEYIVANGGEKAWRVSDLTLDESYQREDVSNASLDMSLMRKAGHLSNILGVEALSDNTLFIWGYTYEGILWWWNPDKDSYHEMVISDGNGQPALSPNFDQIAICTLDGLELIDLETQETSIFSTWWNNYTYLAYAKDAKTIFANAGIIINQIDLESGELIHQLRGHTFNIGKIIISDDGQYLFSMSSGPTGSGFEAAVWQTDPSTKLQKWIIPSRTELKDAVFTQNGGEVIAITDEIYVWRVYDAWYLANISGSTMAISPDGSLAAVSKAGLGFDFYSTSDWKAIDFEQELDFVAPYYFPADAYLNYLTTLIEKVKFLDEGRVLITTDSNGVLQLWKVP